MPSVTVNYSYLREGEEVEVPYLGVFANGSTSEVDQSNWDRFVQLAPGGDRYDGADHIELSDEAALRSSEVMAEATEAVEQGEDLSNRKKAELQNMAEALGIEGASDMNKNELVEAIEKSQAPQAPQA